MSTPRVAVVTGGTRGIGKAITLAMARLGYRVYAIHARNRRAAECLSQEAAKEHLDIRCRRADLSNDEALDSCVTEIKSEVAQIHAVVHSAASGVHREVSQITPKHLAWTFNINVFAIHKLLMAVLPIMPRGGRIVGITSLGGVRSLPFYGAIGSSKGALDALFRHYARELAPRGITVNLVCPGLVLTEAADSFPDKDNRLLTATSRTPTGKLTTPEDVAGLVTFVCSEAANQIVGQTLVIDGGLALGA